jgi:tetratricopeptide (TPR) repeat protein
VSTKDVITIVLSALALTVSVIATVYNAWRQRREGERQFRERITDITGALIDATAKVAEMDGTPVDQRAPDFDYSRGTELQRMAALARQADYLITDDTVSLLTDVDFLTMAQAFGAVGDTAQAALYWTRACDSAQRPFYRAINRRLYAAYLFTLGRPDEGRALYKSAISDLRDAAPQADDQLYSGIGWIYEDWMLSEARRGFSDQAREVKRRAQETYGKIADPQLREWSVAHLERTGQWLTVAPEAATPAVPSLAPMRNPPAAPLA